MLCYSQKSSNISSIMILQLEILFVVIIISLWCVGFYSATRAGYLLYFLREKRDARLRKLRDFKAGKAVLEQRFMYAKSQEEARDLKAKLSETDDWIKSHSRKYDYLMKPVTECLTCMASFHTVLMWCVLPHDIAWYYLPILIICVSGLNSLLKKALNGSLQ